MLEKEFFQMEEPIANTAPETLKNTNPVYESLDDKNLLTTESEIEREALYFIKRNVKPPKRTHQNMFVQKDRDELRLYVNVKERNRIIASVDRKDFNKTAPLSG